MQTPHSEVAMNKAAQALGRLGGQATSEAKTRASPTEAWAMSVGVGLSSDDVQLES